MRKSSLYLGGLVAAVLSIGALARPAVAAPDLTALADRVLGLVNQQRVARGVSPLVRVSPLDRSAQDYAVRMATEDFFAHISPEGETPAGRMLAAGYSWSGWGENIAAGLDTAEAVMDAWMQSPGHAANILSAGYSHIGIGVAVGGTYGIYWVEDFGSPFRAVPGPWAPRLDRLSATTAGAGDLLTLDGADFGSPGGVSFNGVPAFVETWSTSRVSVRVPTGGAGPVILTSTYGTSNGLAFGGDTPAPPPSPAPPSSTPAPTPTPAPVPTPPASTPTPPASTPAPPSPTPPSSPVPPPAPPTSTPAPTVPTPTPILTPTPGVPVTPRPTPPATLTPAPTPPPVSPPAVTPVASPPAPTSSPAPAPSSAAMRYDYLLPNRGPSGTTVQIIGTGFGAASGQMKVSAGTVTILAWSDTEIVIRVEGPKPGRRGLRIIRTDGRQSAIMPFRLTY